METSLEHLDPSSIPNALNNPSILPNKYLPHFTRGISYCIPTKAHNHYYKYKNSNIELAKRGVTCKHCAHLEPDPQANPAHAPHNDNIAHWQLHCKATEGLRLDRHNTATQIILHTIKESQPDDFTHFMDAGTDTITNQPPTRPTIPTWLFPSNTYPEGADQHWFNPDIVILPTPAQTHNFQKRDIHVIEVAYTTERNWPNKLVEKTEKYRPLVELLENVGHKVKLTVLPQGQTGLYNSNHTTQHLSTPFHISHTRANRRPILPKAKIKILLDKLQTHTFEYHDKIIRARHKLDHKPPTQPHTTTT